MAACNHMLVNLFSFNFFTCIHIFIIQKIDQLFVSTFQLHVLVLNLLHALLQTIPPGQIDKLLEIVKHVHSNEPQMVVATASQRGRLIDRLIDRQIITKIDRLPKLIFAEFYEQVIVNSERLLISPQLVINDMIQPLMELLLLVDSAHHVSYLSIDRLIHRLIHRSINQSIINFSSLK